MTLCPQIQRKRFIVEGLYSGPMNEARVRTVLAGLSTHLGMTPIAETLIFSPDAVSELHHGVGGFQAWAESGCSLYTWDESRLFTLDVYTCSGFDEGACLHYIANALSAVRLQWSSPRIEIQQTSPPARFA